MGHRVIWNEGLGYGDMWREQVETSTVFTEGRSGGAGLAAPREATCIGPMEQEGLRCNEGTG